MHPQNNDLETLAGQALNRPPPQNAELDKTTQDLFVLSDFCICLDSNPFILIAPFLNSYFIIKYFFDISTYSTSRAAIFISFQSGVLPNHIS